MKRARGSGGRFLTKEELQLQEQQQPPAATVLGKKNMTSENHDTSCSPSTLTGSESENSSVSTGIDRMLAHQEHVDFLNLGTCNEGGQVTVNGAHHGCVSVPFQR
jgi:hypothetical protein